MTSVQFSEELGLVDISNHVTGCVRWMHWASDLFVEFGQVDSETHFVGTLLRHNYHGVAKVSRLVD